MIRQAITMLMAIPRRNRSAVSYCSSSIRQPLFRTRCQSSMRQRRQYQCFSGLAHNCRKDTLYRLRCADDLPRRNGCSAIPRRLDHDPPGPLSECGAMAL
jgi:hypothetical protein